MTYYSKEEYKHIGFEKSKRDNKMYDALLENKKTGRVIRVPFGDPDMENYQDKTGLNLYPKLIHGDKMRRKFYKNRHEGFEKEGYYSPSYFSNNYLW